MSPRITLPSVNTTSNAATTRADLPVELTAKEIYPQLTLKDASSRGMIYHHHRDVANYYFNNLYKQFFNRNRYSAAQYRVEKSGLSWRKVFINDFNHATKYLSPSSKKIITCIIDRDSEKLKATIAALEQEQITNTNSWTYHLINDIFISIGLLSTGSLREGYLPYFICHVASQEIRDFLFEKINALKENHIVADTFRNFSKAWLGNDLLARIVCNKPIVASQYSAETLNKLLNDISPLHFAVYTGNDSAITALLASPNINYNLKALFPTTPLHLALHLGEANIAKLLLKQKDTQFSEIEEDVGSNEYNAAAQNGMVEIMPEMEKHLPAGANYFYKALLHTVGRTSKDSTPAIDYLIDKCDLTSEDWLNLVCLSIRYNKFPALEKLLTYEDVRQLVPFILVTHPDLLMPLTNAQQDIDIDYKTACRNLIATELQKHINACSQEGYTALILAASLINYENHDNSKEALDLINLLLNLGADPLIKFHDQTALDVFEAEVIKLAKQGVQLSHADKIRQCLNAAINNKLAPASRLIISSPQVEEVIDSSPSIATTSSFINEVKTETQNSNWASPYLKEMEQARQAEPDSAKKLFVQEGIAIAEQAMNNPNENNLEQLNRHALLLNDDSSPHMRRAGIALMTIGSLLALGGCILISLSICTTSTIVAAPLAIILLPIGIVGMLAGAAVLAGGLKLFFKSEPIKPRSAKGEIEPSVSPAI